MNEHDVTDIAPGQEVRVDSFRPEDAPGVVRLFRAVYGDSYPIRTYLDEKLLIAENGAGRTISSVARTARGEVVGHSAFVNSAPYPGLFESCAGLVHSAYRGGKGIFTDIIRHGYQQAKQNPAVQAVVGEPVCNHPYSQKMSVTMGWNSFALEVDLMPASAYAKEASSAGRVAAFLDFKTIRPRPHAVYLPASYAEELRQCYGQLDDEREFRLSEDDIPEGAVTELQPQVFHFAAVARVTIQKVGTDFAACLDQLEKDLADQGVLVTQLWLRLDSPWVGRAVELLRRRGYFLGGPLPRWFDTDGLLLQKIHKRPDWEGICAFNARYTQILERVRADWQRTQG